MNDSTLSLINATRESSGDRDSVSFWLQLKSSLFSFLVFVLLHFVIHREPVTLVQSLKKSKKP